MLSQFDVDQSQPVVPMSLSPFSVLFVLPNYISRHLAHGNRLIFMSEIAFIHPSTPNSEGTGATHSSDRIINSLVNQGFDVTVYCQSDPSDSIKTEQYDMKSLGVSGGPSRVFAEEINRAIDQRKDELANYDLIHSYMPRSIPSMGQLGQEYETQTLVTLNAYSGVCPKNDLLYLDSYHCDNSGLVKCAKCTLSDSRTRSNAERNSKPETAVRSVYRWTKRLREYRQVQAGNKAFEDITAFHALSPSVKNNYIDFGFPESKMAIIPNILDEHFEVKHESDFESPFQLLYVGTLRHRKGVDRLISVVDNLRNQYNRDINLTIAGDGPWKPTLKEMVEDRQLQEHIDFLGHVPYQELPQIYANHDLFVYLGRWDEPFGRVFLEAMASGTPVFATNVGSVTDIVEDAGFITNGDSEGTIAKDLNDILDQEQLKNASHSVNLEPYRSKTVVSDFTQLYDQII